MIRGKLSPMTFGAALVIAAATHADRAHAQAAGDDYSAKLSAEMQACSIVCLDELDLTVFGAITVPFERPSVEYCGVLMSMSQTERAQQSKADSEAVDREAKEKKYSKAEHQELRKRSREKSSKCISDFDKRCAEVRAKFPLEARKSAVAKARKAIADQEASRSAKLSKYLGAVLEKCPLEQP